MNVAEKLMTVEEFAQLPNDGKKYELVEGVLVEVCRPKPIHGKIQARLTRYLDAYVDEHKLGMVTNESGYITHRNPDSLRGPDVAFISTERLGQHDLTAYVPTAPDLVIEIVSEFDTPATVDTKVNEYLAAGAKLIWVVYPDAKRVGAYDDDGHYKGFDVNGVLDGGDVVPNFKLALKDIFRD
jgi:Uma2 family endonuclease